MVMLLVISILINIILMYSTFISLTKIEKHEDLLEECEGRIQWFYDEVNEILTTIRKLDNSEMFEKDDEVGQLFAQIIDITSELRKLIYDTQEAEKEKSLLDE